MTNQIHSNDIQHLFSPDVLADFSGAILGLEENKKILEEQLSTAKIVMYISGFTFAIVTTAAFVLTQMAIHVAVMGPIVIITMVVATTALFYWACLDVYIPVAIERNGKLLEAFQAVTQGNHYTAMFFLNQMIDYPLLSQRVVTDVEPEDEFIEGVSEGFAYLDLKYSSVSQGRSEYMLKTLFARVALMNAFQTMKNAFGTNYPTDATLQVLLCDVSRAYRFTDRQRDWITASERTAYQLFRLPRNEIINSPILAQVRIPEKLSIGHGLLIKMIEHLRSIPENQFDSQGNLRDGLEGGNLKVWKIHLNKIKKQFERDLLDSNFDRGFIDRLLQTHTMREFWQVVRTISDSEIEALKDRFVQYHRM